MDFRHCQSYSGASRAPHLKHPLVDRLNERQEWAVRSALAAPDVYFIQGPPGTGKTTVIAELVNQITQPANWPDIGFMAEAP